MPKHRAEFQLTDQNWDQEEEPEERGEFAKATEDVLKQRKIKKAIRNTNTSSGGSGAFSGFGGFGGLGGTSLFNKPDTNGSSVPAAGSVSAAVKKFENPPADKREEVNGVNKKGDNSGYLKQLKALNEGVLSWIKQHVDKNPYCLLTPIFGDYEKHLSDIEKKYPKKAGSQTDVNKKEESADKAATSPDKIAAVKTDSVLSSSEATSSSNTCQTSTFPTFSFATVTKSEFKPSFSFGASVVNSASSAQAAADGEADEEYVPPKAEVKEIKEEGAVYTKRCKVFYQKEGAWADKGVGNLHLKEVEGKSQLLVRADTNLGNILLNILITKALPTARQGKNNVSLVCVPNPPIDPKKEGDKTPVPMLIRVKTGDDADELLEKINEMKK